MRNLKLKIKPLTMAIGACLTLGAAASLWAQTDVLVTNDGQALSAIVNSGSEDVLSTSIRIVGPNDFVFEKRVEGGAIDWIPEAGLEDGVYHWEAWTVTVSPEAEMRDVVGDMARTELDEATIQHRIDNTPVERFFRGQDKSVTTESGSFRVRDGWLEPADDHDGDSLSEASEPNAFLRFAGGVLNALVPSAHAETFTTDLRVRKLVPRIYWETTGSAQTDWNFAVGNATGDLFLMNDTTFFGSASMIVRENSAANSLVVRGSLSPSVGIGTSAPAQSNFHIRTSRPQIRLEDTSESQNWFIKAANQGAFEIGETWFNSETISSHSAFRIYPDTPEGAMQIQRFQSCAFTFPGQPPNCGVERGRVGINTTPSADLHIRSTEGPPFGPFANHSSATLRLESSSGTAMTVSGGTSLLVSRVGGDSNIFGVHGGAPSNSLRIASDGNVGLGTNSPSTAMHIDKAGRAGFILSAGEGEQADMTYRTGGINRFIFRVNAGSNDFEIARRSATGGFLDSPIRVSYNNGDVQIANALILSESSTPTPPGSGAKLYVDSGNKNLMVRFANGTVKTIATN